MLLPRKDIFCNYSNIQMLLMKKKKVNYNDIPMLLIKDSVITVNLFVCDSLEGIVIYIYPYLHSADEGQSCYCNCIGILLIKDSIRVAIFT